MGGAGCNRHLSGSLGGVVKPPGRMAAQISRKNTTASHKLTRSTKAKMIADADDEPGEISGARMRKNFASGV